MKRCAECRRDYYDDSLLYCLDDGARLLEGPATGPSGGDEKATAILPENLRTHENVLRLSKRLKILFIGIVVLVVATGGVVFVFWGKPSSPSQPLKIERVTTNGKVSDAAISPDGKYVVYVLVDGGQPSVWIKQIASQSEVQILPPFEGKYWWVGFTPDSNFVNFVRQGNAEKTPSLYQMPVLGGVQKLLVSGTYGGVGYSPDGERFAWIQGNSIFIHKSDGTPERTLASVGEPEVLISGWTNPVWSPDGKTIACAVTTDGSFLRIRILAVGASDGTIEPVGETIWGSVRRLVWMLDGSGLLVLGTNEADVEANAQVWQVPFPSGQAKRLTNDFNAYSSMSVTADGNVLAAVQGSPVSNIWIAPIGATSDAVQIKEGGNNRDGLHGIVWTPAGRVLYSSSQSGVPELWIMNADGSGQRPLIAGSGQTPFDPRVTPDDRFVVFVAMKGGKSGLWRSDLEGKNPKKLTDGDLDTSPTISPNSEWVIFSSGGLSRRRVSKVSIEGGQPVDLVDYPSNSPKVSPDGKWIACTAMRPGWVWKPVIIPIEGGEPVNYVDLPVNTIFRWSNDSRYLLYIRSQDSADNIWRFPLDGSAKSQITNFKTERIFKFDLSADGKRLVMARGTKVSDVVLISNFN